MRSLLLATISAIVLGHTAHAEGPSHVKVAQCGPLIRQELVTVVGHPTVVVFPKGESVWLNPTSGIPDPKGEKPVESSVEVIRKDVLEKQPIRNLFTVWPDKPSVTTLTVISQLEDGSLKTYPFTLTAIPDDPGALDNPAVILNLICQSGPVRAPAAAAKTVVAGTEAAPITTPHRPIVPVAERLQRKLDAEERLRTEAFNGVGDDGCHYHAKGKFPSSVEPMCPMDDGQWTLIRFKRLTRKPAVYIGSCEDGADDERLARQHGAGDFVVVEEIAPQFCLRLGSAPNDVLEIVNDAYDPVGKDPGTGTMAAGVRRDLIPAKVR